MQTVLQHPAPHRNTNRAGHTAQPSPVGRRRGPSPRKETRFSAPRSRLRFSAPSESRGQPGPRLPPPPSDSAQQGTMASVLLRNPPHPSKYRPLLSKLSRFSGPVGMPVGDTLDRCLFLSQNDLATDPGRLHNSRKSYHFLKALARSRNCLSLDVLDCLPHKDRKGKITGIHKHY